MFDLIIDHLVAFNCYLIITTQNYSWFAELSKYRKLTKKSLKSSVNKTKKTLHKNTKEILKKSRGGFFFGWGVGVLL